MKLHILVVLCALHIVAAGIVRADDSALTAARRGFVTHLLREKKVSLAVAEPPAGVLDVVSYQGPLGAMAAYVSPSPGDGKRHPAIIWLVGGFSNSISDIAWTPGPPANDQSASGFRDAGIIMMYPSLRGGNNGPGFRETFYGEVDDVIAAARYLAGKDYVDPNRIYLGGHSTGGTLALLVSESTDRFRAVFSLAPVGDVLGYGSDVLTFDVADPKEGQLRAPRLWLDSIRSRTFVFEGTKDPCNIGELRTMAVENQNPLVSFRPIPGHTHFSTIQPLIREISKRILADTGKTVTMDFKTLSEFAGPSKDSQSASP